jgi:hypothetical protein
VVCGGSFTCRKQVKIAEPVLQICSLLTDFVGTETIQLLEERRKEGRQLS